MDGMYHSITMTELMVKSGTVNVITPSYVSVGFTVGPSGATRTVLPRSMLAGIDTFVPDIVGPPSMRGFVLT